MELLKLLSTNEIVAQVACFLILLGILRAFMWGPFLKLLDSRKERVRNDLEKIEYTVLEVDKLKTSYETRLLNIEDERRQKIQEALVEAKKLSDELLKKARQDGDLLLENAKDSIKEEMAKARQELKDSVVDLAIDVAGKVIHERLTEAQDKKLAEDFLKEIDTER